MTWRISYCPGDLPWQIDYREEVEAGDLSFGRHWENWLFGTRIGMDESC